MSNPTLFFIAGDPSGDQNTALIIRRVCKELPNALCCGIGGPEMQAEGFKPFLPFEKFNVMGYLEVITHIPFFLKAKNLIVNKMKTLKPSAVICVDYSGFNMPVMKAAHALGIPVIWYISPKIWVWKKRKYLNNFKKYVSHIAVIFPFEKDIFLPHIKNVSFVGNPTVEQMDNGRYSTPEATREKLQENTVKRLAVIPGSRINEIKNIFPVMISACKKLKKEYPDLLFFISRCGNIPNELYDNIIGNLSTESFSGPLEELLITSDIALVTSGTATLQTALMGVPMVIAYKTSTFNYSIGMLLLRNLKYIGLPNIIASDEIVPEYLQKNMTSEKLAEALKSYIDNPEKYRNVKKRLFDLKEKLGIKKPSKEVTKIIRKTIST